MRALPAIRALGTIDMRNVRRDPMLLFLACLGLALALAMRFGVPIVTDVLHDRADFDLAPYSPLLLSVITLTMPTIVGAVIGFLLLDQRDDGTLSAIQVTPLSMRGYLLYRLAAPMLVSFVVTIIAMPLSGLMTMGWLGLLVSAAIAAPMAPLFALFIASVAANKVQGFALMKASGVVSWPALIGWFIPLPWQLACGVVPHYWIAKVVWMLEGGEDGVWLYTGCGIIVQAALIMVFLKRFERVSQR